MKKAIISVFLSLILVLSMFSCGDDDDDGDNTGTGSGTAENWIPLANGNKWTLEGSVTDNSIKTTVTSVTTIIGDTTFADKGSVKYGERSNHIVSVREMINDTISDTTEVFRIYASKTDDYYEFGFVDTTDEIHWVRIIKLPAKVDDNWQSDPDDNTSHAQTMRFEDISTPKGDFKGCVVIDNYYKNQYNEYTSPTTWYSKDIGTVRTQFEIRDDLPIILDLIDYKLY
ncbi:MAG: hypothetical protein JXA60_02720 [Candidatus Coatesbacteria bacterium]|nr:hypothetical protein [Candidatus Coatesbacteria bacterium]